MMRVCPWTWRWHSMNAFSTLLAIDFMYSISYGSSGLLPHHPSICIASILGVCKCWRLAADAEEASSSCFRSAENASLKQWMAGYYFRYKSITFLLRTMTFHDISLQIIGWEIFAAQITSNVTEKQVLSWCQVQKRKSRQDDCHGDVEACLQRFQLRQGQSFWLPFRFSDFVIIGGKFWYHDNSWFSVV